ncbi:MAG: hypothetical protein KAR40_07650 [Candidatus Sabulitectum sp.]|nr:hypothetical protein [Candidatus Sabulitectum sp.]
MGTQKKQDTPLLLEEGLPFIETELDFQVEIEIVESDSYQTRLKEFVELTAKAISIYSTRFDGALADIGPSTLYSDYIQWRKTAAAIQSASRAKHELSLAEEDLSDLDKEIARMRREIEKLHGAGCLDEMKESGK